MFILSGFSDECAKDFSKRIEMHIKLNSTGIKSIENAIGRIKTAKTFILYPEGTEIYAKEYENHIRLKDSFIL